MILQWPGQVFLPQVTVGKYEHNTLKENSSRADWEPCICSSWAAGLRQSMCSVQQQVRASSQQCQRTEQTVEQSQRWEEPVPKEGGSLAANLCRLRDTKAAQVKEQARNLEQRFQLLPTAGRVVLNCPRSRPATRLYLRRLKTTALRHLFQCRELFF